MKPNPRTFVPAWVALVAAGYAAAYEDGGTTVTGARSVRAAFLARPTSARPVGMGEASVAVADDASAVSGNPGGLGQLDGLSLVATYDGIDREIGMSYLAAAYPVGPGVLAAGLTVMSYGSYQEFDDQGNLNGTRSLVDLGGAAGWAILHPDWMPLSGWSGVSIELARETVGGTLVGFGAGSVIVVGPAWTVGWAATHLGPARDGTGLPASVRAGACWAPGAERIRIAVDAGRGIADRETFVAGGVEARPVDRLALRAGWRHGFAAARPGGLVGLTAGFGLAVGGVAVDYAYQPFGEVAVSHKVSLVWGAASGAGDDR